MTQQNVDITSLLQRVAALEAENAQLRSALDEQNKSPNNKRQKRKKADRETEDSNSERQNEQTPRKRQKQDPTTKLIQKYLKKWGKAVDRKISKTKFQQHFTDDPILGEVVIEDTIVRETFEAIFQGKGHILQPLPDYKPTSVLHIIEFETWTEIEDLFGKENLTRDQNKVAWVWAHVPFFGLRRTYQTRIQIDSLRVEYNRTKMKLKLLFRCSANESEEGRSGLPINSTTNLLDHFIGINPLQVLRDPTQRVLLPQQIQEQLQFKSQSNSSTTMSPNVNNTNKSLSNLPL